MRLCTYWDTIKEIVSDILDTIKWLGNRVKKSYLELLKCGFDFLFIPIIVRYYWKLTLQAKGKWKKLPQLIIDTLQPYFNINLNSIRYAQNINTGHGRAVTFGSRIFFPVDISLDTNKVLRILIHTIAHSQQYSDLKGFKPFFRTYTKQFIYNLIRYRTIHLHKFIPLEITANRIADDLLSVGNSIESDKKTLFTCKQFSFGLNLF